MKLIVGLGNPGRKYAQTRHNVGFDVIDRLMERNHLAMTDQKFQADYTVWHHQGERILLVKPFTYMNLSGEALLPLMSYFNVDPDDVVVVYDDLDLAPGRLRLRQRGSAGGHNGMKSVLSLLGSQELNRIRVGIGRPTGGWKVVDHVLAPFGEDDRIEVDLALDRAAQALEEWVDGATFLEVMNHYNGS